MEGLRNPFAVRNGKIILIEDLSINERGLKCHCQCPACDGELIARMGDIKVHHFAHSKDSCDEVIAYISGLYRLIKQILGSGASFYIPSLVVEYHFSYKYELNESNIGSHVKIVPEWYEFEEDNLITISDGREIVFDSVEFCYDSKGVIQALEMTCKNSKMALKVMPPDTICKIGTVSPHKDMATLVLDFTGDADKIQDLKSKAFEEYLLSENLPKLWINNPKVKKAYPIVMRKRESAYKKYLKRQEILKEEAREKQQREERMKLEAQRYETQVKIGTKQREEKERQNVQQKQVNAQKMYVSGYEQGKGKFTQQTEQIRDNYNCRWVQCELCGEIKPESEFSSYGGLNHINLGHCSACSRKHERNN